MTVMGAAMVLMSSMASSHAAPVQLRERAHPPVRGAAGPYRATMLTLRRTGTGPLSPFTGVLDVGGGKRLALTEPDEPDGFFYLDIKAVVFTPIDRTRANGIVILYNSSRIGPQHGTDRRALVFRVEADRTIRVPAIEERLVGVITAAEARARLSRR